jgi:hypothetical protein
LYVAGFNLCNNVTEDLSDDRELLKKVALHGMDFGSDALDGCRMLASLADFGGVDLCQLGSKQFLVECGRRFVVKTLLEKARAFGIRQTVDFGVDAPDHLPIVRLERGNLVFVRSDFVIEPPEVVGHSRHR